MTERRDLVGGRRVPALVQGGQDLRVGLVAEAVQLREQLAGPGLVEAGLHRQRAQRLEVEVEAPCVRVEAAELAPVQLDRRLLLAEEAVAGELDLELDPLPARRALQQRCVAVMLVQALRRATVQPQRRLAR
jgi:hypothetical protein